MRARHTFAATVALTFLFLLITDFGEAAQQKAAAVAEPATAAPKPAVPEPVTSAPPAVIPLADIATQATEESNLLGS